MPRQKKTLPAPATKNTADAVYQERLKLARERLEEISRKLDAHEAAQKANPTNWGFTGDLGYVVDTLGELAESVIAED